jgi:hypothetical protein
MSKGIDIPIDAMITDFTANLWTGYSTEYYGRIFLNEKTDKQGNTVIVPEAYVSSSGKYKEVLYNSKLAALVFCDVTSENPINNVMVEARVRICFAVNLATLYPAIGERATEYAHSDAFKRIQLARGFVFGEGELIRGAKAFDGYGFVDQKKMDMQPRYLFGVDCVFEYELINC